MRDSWESIPRSLLGRYAFDQASRHFRCSIDPTAAGRGALFPARTSNYNHGMTRLLFCLACTGSLIFLSGCADTFYLPPMAEGEEVVW